MNLRAPLALCLAFLVAFANAVSFNDSSAVDFTNNTVVVADDSSKPFVWSVLGDSWAVSISQSVSMFSRSPC